MSYQEHCYKKAIGLLKGEIKSLKMDMGSLQTARNKAGHRVAAQHNEINALKADKAELLAACRKVAIDRFTESWVRVRSDLRLLVARMEQDS